VIARQAISTVDTTIVIIQEIVPIPEIDTNTGKQYHYSRLV